MPLSIPPPKKKRRLANTSQITDFYQRQLATTSPFGHIVYTQLLKLRISFRLFSEQVGLHRKYLMKMLNTPTTSEVPIAVIHRMSDLLGYPVTPTHLLATLYGRNRKIEAHVDVLLDLALQLGTEDIETVTNLARNLVERQPANRRLPYPEQRAAMRQHLLVHRPPSELFRRRTPPATQEIVEENGTPDEGGSQEVHMEGE